MEDKRCKVCDKKVDDHTYIEHRECWHKEHGYGQDWADKEKIVRNEEV